VPEAELVFRGGDLQNFVLNWHPKEVVQVSWRQETADKMAALLPNFSPDIIYMIARDCLEGCYDGYDNGATLDESNTPISDGLFLECWKVERANNGPVSFLKAMPDGYQFKIEQVLRGEFI
jgi:hypothetical protein